MKCAVRKSVVDEEPARRQVCGGAVVKGPTSTVQLASYNFGQLGRFASPPA